MSVKKPTHTNQKIDTSKKPIRSLKTHAKTFVSGASVAIRNRIKNMSRKRKIFVLISILIILAVAATIVFVTLVSQPSPQPSTTQDINKPYTVAELPQGAPDFDTILPADKTIEDFGGWTRVSPSTASPVYAYADILSEIPIRVSQQPLPDGFDDDTAEQISALAADLGASKVLNVGNTVVYIGNSSKGPQSLVLTMNSLLILIKSSAPIANDQWASYIQSLQ